MGRLIKADGTSPASVPLSLEDVKALLRGEKCLAELEGMTWQEAQAIAQMGCELAAAGRLEEARVLFEGLVAGNPADAAALAALGTVYQKLGMPVDARREYDAALAVDSDHPVALAGRGELRLRGGDARGLEDLRRAVEVDPEGETAAGRRARALLETAAPQR